MKDHFAAKLEEMKQRHISTALYRVQELGETPAQACAKLRENSTLGEPVWSDILARLQVLVDSIKSEEANQD